MDGWPRRLPVEAAPTEPRHHRRRETARLRCRRSQLQQSADPAAVGGRPAARRQQVPYGAPPPKFVGELSGRLTFPTNRRCRSWRPPNSCPPPTAKTADRCHRKPHRHAGNSTVAVFRFTGRERAVVL